jgi:hypothetical protein
MNRQLFINLKDAIINDRINFIRYKLINNHFPINYRSNLNGRTLLHNAVLYKKVRIIKMLLELGALRNILDNMGRTAFFLACKNGLVTIVRIFLRYSIRQPDIDMEIPDDIGNTPLLISLYNNHYIIAKYLIENGANYNLRRIPRELINRLFEFSVQGQQINRSPILVSENRVTVIKPKKEIIDMIIKLSIDKKENCPIKLVPLEFETSIVTSCYHVFDKESMIEWHSRNTNCPVCRTNCVLWI